MEHEVVTTLEAVPAAQQQYDSAGARGKLGLGCTSDAQCGYYYCPL